MGIPYQKSPNICPVCQKEANFQFIQDYKNEYGEWSLYECLECQVQFWMPFEGPGKEWYETLPGYVVRDITKPKIVKGYHKQFLKTYKNFPQNIKVLDLGCGTGEFLAELQKRGCEVWGVDFDKNAIEIAKSYFKLKNVHTMSFDEFFQLPNLPKFDIITFFEVIEHLDNPLEFIQNVKDILKEDGLLVLSTPSRERILVNSIKTDFPYHHLSRWNETAISNLFRKINFKIIRVDYIEQFQFILDALSERFRFGLVMKTVKVSHNKENIVPKATFLTKIVHLAAHLKDYFLCALPAAVLFLIGKFKKQKNGTMLIWLKKNMNKIFPKVSVIIPTHNRPQFVGRAIQSVLNQTYKNFEIVVVDDSSNNETEEIVKIFNDNRIIYKKNKTRITPAAARNQGVKESAPDSQYIAFLDDDDEWLPRFLEKSIERLEEKKELIGVCPAYEHRLENGKTIGRSLEVDECWNTGIGNGDVLRKSLFTEENIWFDEKIERLDDLDFGIRILKNHKVEAITEPLHIYYHRFSYKGEKISTRPVPIDSIDYFFQKHFSYYQTLGRKPLSFFYFVVGKHYCRSSGIKKGKQFFLRAFLASPNLVYIGYYLFWSFPKFAENFYLENLLHKILKFYGKFKR